MALYRKRFNGRALRELDAVSFIENPHRKQSYVTFMFDLLAPGYDAFTRLFSFGMDSRWKRRLVELVARAVRETGPVADLACGTADISARLLDRLPKARVIGIDISTEMIRVASSRPRSPRLAFAVGDVCRLCLASGSVGGVTIGYGLRNLPSLDGGLSEIHRVLSADGVVGILDFFKPRQPLWRWVFLRYLLVSGAVAGWIWHGDPTTFTYIPRSVEHFVTMDEAVVSLRRLGFRVLEVEQRLGGGIGLLVATARLDDVSPPDGLGPS